MDTPPVKKIWQAEGNLGRLAALLDDPEIAEGRPRNREHLVMFIVATKDPRRSEALGRMATTDPDPGVRFYASRMLFECDDKAVAPHLGQILRDEAPLIRETALRFVARHGGQDVRVDVERNLRDSRSDIRKHAIRAISKIGARDSAARLTDLTADRDATVAAEAVRALVAVRDASVGQAVRAKLRTLPIHRRVRIFAAVHLRRNLVRFLTVVVGLTIWAWGVLRFAEGSEFGGGLLVLAGGALLIISLRGTWGEFLDAVLNWLAGAR